MVTNEKWFEVEECYPAQLEPVQYLFMCGFSSIILPLTASKKDAEQALKQN